MDCKTVTLKSWVTIMSDLRQEAGKNPFLLFSWGPLNQGASCSLASPETNQETKKPQILISIKKNHLVSHSKHVLRFQGGERLYEVPHSHKEKQPSDVAVVGSFLGIVMDGL